VKVTRQVGYLCPDCEEVHADPPEERRVLVFPCGGAIAEQRRPEKGTYYQCGECGAVFADRDQAKGCCRA
jgi:predicted RNA-binding Zn-ribbon protein involved in translation (DUF1610 family)